MIDTKDILERIESDFGERALEVVGILEAAISKAEHLNNHRILRCILFLANKDLAKLKSSIDSAIADPRDVMFWAEYLDREQMEGVRRVRDFSHPFDQAQQDRNE